MVSRKQPRILIVDLNNFARYPTVAIGYLVAVLRQAGIDVSVFSPLSSGVSGVVREPRAKVWGAIDQRLRYWSAVSRNPIIRHARRRMAAFTAPKLAQQAELVVKSFEQRLSEQHFDAVLISTYLMYHRICQGMGRVCRKRNLPLLIGGAYFSQPEVLHEWREIEGLYGIVTGEVELQLPQIVRAMVAGEDVRQCEGIWRPGAAWCGPPPPLQNLDAVPFPDYTDFPWHKYPNKIIPLISGRGCGWGACMFCSDITSTAGRTFRSRSTENVLAEIQFQHAQHASELFAFTDLKLNSNLTMWEGLLDNLQRAAPNARWIAAVHVGAKQPNGLSRDELKAARAAGMVRLTTGLESGSQRVLDSMAKGTDLAITSQCIRNARQAGISVRTTMVLGYPGEDAGDVDRSAKFLEQHVDCIERVSLNRFMIMTGTRFHRKMERTPSAYPGVTPLTVNNQLAQIDHEYEPNQSIEYRRSVSRLLTAVHRINRKPLMEAARAFEGVM